MEPFVFFGNYTSDSIRNVSAARTAEARKIVESAGGRVREIYALFGDKDLMIVAELPGLDAAARASVALTGATGIEFTTAPAIEVERFDELAGK